MMNKKRKLTESEINDDNITKFTTKEDIEELVKNKTLNLTTIHTEKIKNQLETFLKDPTSFYMFKIKSRAEYHNERCYIAETYIPEELRQNRYLITRNRAEGFIPSQQLREGVFYQIEVKCPGKLSEEILEPFKNLVSYCDTNSGYSYCLYVKVFKY